MNILKMDNFNVKVLFEFKNGEEITQLQGHPECVFAALERLINHFAERLEVTPQRVLEVLQLGLELAEQEGENQ